MLKVILFGPSSLGKENYAKPKTWGKLWDVTRTTPGAIAFVAVMVRFFFHTFECQWYWLCFQARFFLSPDEEFAPQGAKSQIHYQKDFNAYKYLLIAKANNKYIKDLFKFYDSIVFTSRKIRTNEEPTYDGDSSDIEDAMNILDDSDDMQDVAEPRSDRVAPGEAGVSAPEVPNDGAAFAAAPLLDNHPPSTGGHSVAGSGSGRSKGKGKGKQAQAGRTTRSRKTPADG